MEVTVVEVGPRDGLQNEERVLSPAARARLIERLAAAGLPRIEAVSFVHPGRVPTMAGAEGVADSLSPTALGRSWGLVLNERGYERLASTSLRGVRLAVACTESFSRRNTGLSIEKAVSAAELVIRRAHTDGRTVGVTLAVSLGCPFEGVVSRAVVLSLAERFLAAGADELVFADTVGMGVPSDVTRLVGAVVDAGVPIGVHLHDTRNTAIAGALAAVHAGATVLDASVGGLGGCPFAPGATGNVATEDLVYVLHREGVATGVDLDALLSIAHELPGLVGHEIPGAVQKAGPGLPAPSAAP
jgi:hydroxymethylglutaryl-CoA lyase/(R)-citramalyl-CoA lyase